MNVVLMMFRDSGDPRSFSLTREVTVIGRREDADFRIPLSDISRKHCRFIKDGPVLVLEDLGSSNGTFVNGKRIQDTELEPGDVVHLGPVQFVVQIDGVPSEEEMLEQRGQAPRAKSPNGHTTDISAFAPPPIPPDDLLTGLHNVSGDHPTIDDDDLLVDFDVSNDSK